MIELLPEYVWRIQLPDGSFYCGEGTYRGRGAGVWLSRHAAVLARRWSGGCVNEGKKLKAIAAPGAVLVRYRLVLDDEP